MFLNIYCENCAINRSEKKKSNIFGLNFGRSLPLHAITNACLSLTAHKIPSLLLLYVTSNLCKRPHFVFVERLQRFWHIFFFFFCSVYELIKLAKNKSVNTVHRTVNIILNLNKQNLMRKKKSM